MRKIIVSEMISVDGYFAGPNGELDWHVVEDEFNQHAIDLLKTLDTILFGRITYQLFESYWPAAAQDPKTSRDELVIAHKINDIKKIVFSKSLQSVDWNNSELLHEIVAEEITKMKQQHGKNMVIYGSGTIVSAFAEYGLIDEYRLFVSPVVLGNGKPLFTNMKHRLNLELVKTEPFGSGVVLLTYVPSV